LPLGDLNWFPASKTKWATKQSEIMSWIVALNETRFIITSVEQENGGIPNRFEVSQNYPNPFNPSTEITYSVPLSGLVTLKVYNALGQLVATLVNNEQSAGQYIVKFDASSLASGVYMYQIHAGNNTATRKMMLMR
jgi:hypothetical protein